VDCSRQSTHFLLATSRIAVLIMALLKHDRRIYVIKEQLRDFIKNELLHDPNFPLQDDEPLITGGLIDSFSLVQVQLFIDEAFGVFIEDPAMTVANMDTINMMVAAIESRKA
jgi:acyl carrier protein